MLRFLLFFVFMLFPLSASAQITGSSHDFSAESWNSTGEICQPCHTPHNADLTVTNSPLWNHAVSTATFTVYSTTTLDATVAQPTGISLLCLSCHDGTVAIDSYGGATGTSFITGATLLGTDLSDDHPIGFTYDTTLSTTDGELFDPATALSGLGGTIGDDLLFGGLMECASCHDAHNSGALAGLLLKSNAASALCLTCHDK